MEESTLSNAIGPTGPGRRPTALVVDDDPSVCAVLEVVLRKLGCSVETAANGTEAHERMGRRPLDIIVTDLCMPEEDGFALLNRIRARWRGTPVIAMSAGVPGLDVLSAAVRLGANAAMRKPIDRDLFEAEDRRFLKLA